MNVLFIQLPTGQVSWHFHDSEVEWFDWLPVRPEKTWDGHTEAEKYQRVVNPGDLPKVWLFRKRNATLRNACKAVLEKLTVPGIKFQPQQAADLVDWAVQIIIQVLEDTTPQMGE